MGPAVCGARINSAWQGKKHGQRTRFIRMAKSMLAVRQSVVCKASLRCRERATNVAKRLEQRPPEEGHVCTMHVLSLDARARICTWLERWVVAYYSPRSQGPNVWQKLSHLSKVRPCSIATLTLLKPVCRPSNPASSQHLLPHSPFKQVTTRPRHDCLLGRGRPGCLDGMNAGRGRVRKAGGVHKPERLCLAFPSWCVCEKGRPEVIFHHVCASEFQRAWPCSPRSFILQCIFC